MPAKTLIVALLAVAAAVSSTGFLTGAAWTPDQGPAANTPATPADVVFRNGDVYTMDPGRPWARGVAVRGSQIAAVLEGDAIPAGFIGPKTRVVDLGGRMLLPGLIDGHVHFNQAGALIIDINLMTVAGDYGHYRPHTSDDPKLLVPNMEKMYGLIKTGYAAGFVSNVHAIGDRGTALMLDTYERLMKDLGRDLEGFRVSLQVNVDLTMVDGRIVFERR